MKTKNEPTKSKVAKPKGTASKNTAYRQNNTKAPVQKFDFAANKAKKTTGASPTTAKKPATKTVSASATKKKATPSFNPTKY